MSPKSLKEPSGPGRTATRTHPTSDALAQSRPGKRTRPEASRPVGNVRNTIVKPTATIEKICSLNHASKSTVGERTPDANEVLAYS